jgi:hypothetical protein
MSREAATTSSSGAEDRDKWRRLREWRREYLHPDTDLPDQREVAEHAEKLKVSGLSDLDLGDLDSTDLDRTLEVHIEAGKAEQDRETNLNARGATVAAVAGIAVAISSAVAKSVAQTPRWTDLWKILSLALFVAALFWVASAMMMAVMGVLRPTRGSGTKNFLGETLISLAREDHGKSVVLANKDRLNLIFLECCMRTLPAWHYRNRRKARWLRRAWVLLAAGTAALAIAAILVLARVIKVIDADPDGPATRIEWWHIVAFVSLVAVGTWIAVAKDFLLAARREGARTEPKTDSVRDARIEARNREIVDTWERLRESPMSAGVCRNDDEVTHVV